MSYRQSVAPPPLCFIVGLSIAFFGHVGRVICLDATLETQIRDEMLSTE